MVVTGKGYGQTNLIAFDPGGAAPLERQLRVLPAKAVVVLQDGASRLRADGAVWRRSEEFQ